MKWGPNFFSPPLRYARIVEDGKIEMRDRRKGSPVPFQPTEELDLTGIPDVVLHTFACDVVEHILEEESDRRGSIPSVFWDALSAKRSWYEGLLSDELLDGVRKRLYSDEKNLFLVALEAIFSVDYAMDRNCVDAANKAIYWAVAYWTDGRKDFPGYTEIKETVLKGYQQHLRKVLLDYLWRPFCEAVEYVAMQETVLAYHQKTLEDPLFE